MPRIDATYEGTGAQRSFPFSYQPTNGLSQGGCSFRPADCPDAYIFAIDTPIPRALTALAGATVAVANPRPATEIAFMMVGSGAIDLVPVWGDGSIDPPAEQRDRPALTGGDPESPATFCNGLYTDEGACLPIKRDPAIGCVGAHERFSAVIHSIPSSNPVGVVRAVRACVRKPAPRS